MATTKSKKHSMSPTTKIVLVAVGFILVICVIVGIFLVNQYQKNRLDDKYMFYAKSVSASSNSPSERGEKGYIKYNELITHINDDILVLLHEGSPSTVSASRPLAFQWCEGGNKVSYWSPVSNSAHVLTNGNTESCPEVVQPTGPTSLNHHP